MRHCVKYFLWGKHILEGETFFRDNIMYATMYAGGLCQALQDGEQTAGSLGSPSEEGAFELDPHE